MKMHRVGFFAFTLTSIAAFAAANAADMYVPSAPGPGGYKDDYVPLWTGFYAGVNGGYGWGDSKLTATDSRHCTRTEAADHVPGCADNLPHFGTLTDTETKRFGTDGGFGGGQIGYNWQPAIGSYKDGPARGNWVLGVEADIQGSGIDGSGSVSLLGGTGGAKGTSDLEWFGTLRGRAGYAFGGTLVYATGGLAFGGVKDKLSISPTSGTPLTVSTSATDTGYVVGGGLEHYLSRAWSVKGEYQYIDLGHDKISAPAGSAAATLDADHAYHTVRVGLNYHFLPGYEPLK